MKKKILVSYIKSPSKWGEMLFQQSKALFEHFVLEQENKSGNAQYEFEVTDVVDEMIKTGNFPACLIARCILLAPVFILISLFLMDRLRMAFSINISLLMI